MSKSRNQKVKLLYILDILRKETDEMHPITASDLVARLEQNGIQAERKSIYDDIDNLEQFGFDIICRKEIPRGYYLGEREFELPELKLLVDSVVSAKFITAKKSEELIRKLKQFASHYEAGELQRQIVVKNRIKTENEGIYYNIDMLHDAIHAGREIQFQYWNWNVKKEMELRRNGALYKVSPYKLCWDDENYYLIAYDNESSQIKHYRVDKMKNIEVLRSPGLGREEFRNFDMAEYAKSVFSMFGGKEEVLKLRMENELVGVVMDQFGHDVPILKADEEHFDVRVHVALSGQFFGWLVGLSGRATIVEPEYAVTQYKNHLQNIIEDM